jgi:hypothetical protein
VWPYLRKQAGELGERLKQKDSLLNKCEALSSNPSATKKKKKAQAGCGVSCLQFQLHGSQTEEDHGQGLALGNKK